jgi:hypothetical protein
MKTVALVILLAAALAACSSKSEPSRERVADPVAHDAAGPAADADPRSVLVLKPIAPGPYVVSYDCTHSNMPFGPGGWSRSQSIDLAAHTWTSLEVTTTGKEDDVPPDRRPAPPQPTVSKASASVVMLISAAVDKVLRGGPYLGEYPVPEGVPCVLAIRAGPTIVFQIEKAATAERDAVSELVNLFSASVGT